MQRCSTSLWRGPRLVRSQPRRRPANVIIARERSGNQHLQRFQVLVSNLCCVMLEGLNNRQLSSGNSLQRQALHGPLQRIVEMQGSLMSVWRRIYITTVTCNSIGEEATEFATRQSTLAFSMSFGYGDKNIASLTAAEGLQDGDNFRNKMQFLRV